MRRRLFFALMFFLAASAARADGRRHHHHAPVAAAPEVLPPINPWCDYGYPYSGSSRYFADPLTKLRHTEPFGALLGYHARRPC